MASQKPPTTLGKLEFADIKRSLTEYLRTQSILSGYEFEGSAIATVIDLLAYNSYYYAFYSNMIAAEAFLDSAQRIESIISLTKHLGYTIPSKTASKIKVIMTQVSENRIPQYSVFYGKDSEGTEYKFYNLEEIPVVDSQTDEFYIYEGRLLIDIEGINLIDIERQRLTIVDSDFDLETLEVRVAADDDPLEVWNRIDNIGYSNTIEEKIYFVERTQTGFTISFGLVNSVGRNITDADRSIRVRYLRTNGSKANDLTTFTSALGTVLIDSSSSGGKDEPSLDTVKFLAPKWFAAQERAVTVNDYKALILEAGFFEDETQFNVYGGEDIFPKRYGRVFITSEKSITEVVDMLEFIKERSVITVLPEYVSSVPLNVLVNFKFGFSDGVGRTNSQRQTYLSRIKSIFNEKYLKVNTFNLYFSTTSFIEDVTTQYPEVFMVPEYFDLFVEQTVNASVSDYTLNLQNKIKIASGEKLILSDPFFAPSLTTGQVVYYIDNTQQTTPIKRLKIGNLDLSNEYEGDFGSVNINSGVVYIKSKVMTSPTKIIVPFENKNIDIGLNNLIVFNYKEIEII